MTASLPLPEALRLFEASATILDPAGFERTLERVMAARAAEGPVPFGLQAFALGVLSQAG
jgi:hypothetical protein